MTIAILKYLFVITDRHNKDLEYKVIFAIDNEHAISQISEYIRKTWEPPSQFNFKIVSIEGLPQGSCYLKF